MLFNFEDKYNQLAIISEQGTFTYSQLQDEANVFTFNSQSKELVLIICDNTVSIIAAYIATIQQGHAAMLLSNTLSEDLLNNIIDSYEPRWIVSSSLVQAKDYIQTSSILCERQVKSNYVIHQDLALLLSTSGTTGSQKFVRLSQKNLLANAQSIVDYLEITSDERAIMNLPFSYSYGLSIVNSHFLVGATVILTNESVVTKKFWELLERSKATSLPGVPFTYQLLNKIGLHKKSLPYLTTLTQAGGRLDTKLVELFGQYAKRHNKRFFVMYGQTEAAPRISYVPYNRLLEKVGSIGIAIPGGKLSLDEETGELIYFGDNVMLGYATNISDIGKGDECFGVLRTGDVAIQDEDGYFTIVGRMKRFIKLFGLRINLDEIEKRLESLTNKQVACVGNDDKLKIVIEDDTLVAEVKTYIQNSYKLHHTAFEIVVVEQLPRFSNGKINYQALRENKI